MNQVTHYDCNDQLNKLGGKTPCCDCTGHKCRPDDGVVVKAKPEPTETYEDLGQSTEKPDWLEGHACRFNDGEQSCDCFVAGYKKGMSDGSMLDSFIEVLAKLPTDELAAIEEIRAKGEAYIQERIKKATS